MVISSNTSRSSEANSDKRSTDGKKNKLDLHLYKDKMVEETAVSFFLV